METHVKNDGFTALFDTRREAELAIERLVQEHGLARNEIFAEPAGETATAGVRAGGGDHASGAPSSGEREDAPLKGAIRLTVPFTEETMSRVREALEAANGRQIART